MTRSSRRDDKRVITTDGLPGLHFSGNASNVNGGKPYWRTQLLWPDVKATKLVCGSGVVVGLDEEGSAWCTPGNRLRSYREGSFLLDNGGSESGVKVGDVHVYGH